MPQPSCPSSRSADAGPDGLTEVLLCQRFLPEHGGSIRWMYEVYRRWPQVVEVVTHDYDNAPRGTAMAQAPAHPTSGDVVADENLILDRRDIFMGDWGLDRPGQLVRYWRMMRAVAERLKRGGRVRVHCIHAVPEAVSLLPLKALYRKRLSIICYAHGEEITACQSSRQLTWLMRRAHRGIDLMLANSRYTRDLAAKYIDPARLAIVHPGVDLPAFEPAARLGRQWRAQMGLGERPVVLTVGRLDPRKNQMAVIEAMARLGDRFGDAVYIVAGDGRHRPALERRAAELGLGERVRFTGMVDGQMKLALYGACDVFAMPAVQDGTDVEGFGMVFLEAAACGKPSLAGASGGQPDAVRDGRTGLVVDGADLDAVTAALARLLGDRPWRTALGEAAYAWASGLDWPRVVQRTVELTEMTEVGLPREKGDRAGYARPDHHG